MVSLPGTGVPSDPNNFPISTLGELFEQQAKAYRDKPFVHEGFSGCSMTYGELYAEAGNVATALADAGLTKGDIVATLMANSIDHLLVWFGSLRLGVTYAPLNVEFGHEDLAHCLRTVDPEAIVIDDQYVEQYAEIRPSVTPSHEFIRHGDLDNADPFTMLTESVSGDPTPDLGPGDDAIITFTGGTTGLPKPILHAQFAPLVGAYRYIDAFSAEESDVHHSSLQLYHGGGQQFAIVGPMMAGMSTVLTERFSVTQFFDQVNRYEATISDTVGPMLGALLNTYDDPVDNTLEKMLAMMEDNDHARAYERFNVDLVKPYALTEGGGILLTHRVFHPSDLDDEGEGTPVGSIDGWGEIGILDERDVPLPPGEVGEICLRPTIPHSMMERVYNDPEATIDIWNQLWIHTGDLGWLDDDGELYYVGRQAHWLRRMGENISSQEVEAVLNDHPAVVDSAVVGAENQEIGGEDVRAIIKVSDEIEPIDLVDWCRDRLAEFKLPRYVEIVDEFPRTSTKNKIKRYELRERPLDETWDFEQTD